MNRGTMAVLSAFALTTVSCRTIGAHFHKYGLARAAFELQCPRNQLTVWNLHDPLEEQAWSGSQVGVTGCGKRAVYVLTRQAGWLLDSQSESR